MCTINSIVNCKWFYEEVHTLFIKAGGESIFTLILEDFFLFLEERWKLNRGKNEFEMLQQSEMLRFATCHMFEHLCWRIK